MTTPTDDSPIPAMYDHCQTIYNAMLEDATEEFVHDEEFNRKTPTGFQIWEGATTSLFAKAELAAPYYTGVLGNLKRMGCIELIARGGGAKKSKWRLIREPTEKLFRAAEQLKKPANGSLAALKQQVNDLTQRVNTLEDNYTKLLRVAQKLSEDLSRAYVHIESQQERLEAHHDDLMTMHRMLPKEN